MGKILGLGGVFYRCENVEDYRKWWSDHMNTNITDWGNIEWLPDGKGRTMMSPFKEDTDYLDPSEQPFMINLRVDDVVSLLASAKAGGARLVGDIQDTEYGIFGWFIDPAGIKIELWQEPG